MEEILNGIEFHNLGNEVVLTLTHAPETSTIKVVKAPSYNELFFRLPQSPLVINDRPTFSIDLWSAPSLMERLPSNSILRTSTAAVRASLIAAQPFMNIATWNSPGIEGIDFPLKFDTICEAYNPDMFVFMDVHAPFDETSGFFNERGYTANYIVPAAANTGAIWIFSKTSVYPEVSNLTIPAIGARIHIARPSI